MSADPPAVGEYDRDVVVVGGGPAGCSAGVFAARYGLDTVVYDRGRSSLRRCAHLENYLGFPAGVDVETFYDLIHDHAREAGCAVRADLVESVERTDDGGGFVVEPQEGDRIVAGRAVAATRYGGEYLRPIGGDEMFVTRERDGDDREHFDRDYPDEDGRTPVDGLYVATPSEADEQAILAAGRGARVGRALIRDVRLDHGIPEEFADHYDWVRRWDELDEEWRDRDRWREWFDERVPADHDLDPDELAELREAEIDRVFGTYVDEEAVERRRERGQDRLLEHVDDERVLARAAEIEAERESADAGD